MSDWFFMVGEPLAAAEREQACAYLRGLGLEGEVPIEGVPDFDSAGRIIRHPDWDRSWWDSEQRERERLRAKAASAHGGEQLVRSLSSNVEQCISATHGAAAVQAARVGCSDAGLIRAAAGALAEALYLASLAELAGETASHSFFLKHALFAGGHWPLAVVNGRYWIF